MSSDGDLSPIAVPSKQGFRHGGAACVSGSSQLAINNWRTFGRFRRDVAQRSDELVASDVSAVGSIQFQFNCR